MKKICTFIEKYRLLKKSLDFWRKLWAFQKKCQDFFKSPYLYRSLDFFPKLRSLTQNFHVFSSFIKTGSPDFLRKREILVEVRISKTLNFKLCPTFLHIGL